MTNGNFTPSPSYQGGVEALPPMPPVSETNKPIGGVTSSIDDRLEPNFNPDLSSKPQQPSLPGEGTNGKSAYEIAVEAGFRGTESQWLESLVGKSAYQVAQDGGYTGTRTEWLESLKGANGKSAYQVAAAGGYGGTEAQWLDSLKGAQGKSAYEVAVANGFQGTVYEWLASLKGADGKPVDVLTTALTGLLVTSDNPIAAIDTIIGALGKLQTQMNKRVVIDGTKVLSDNNFTNTERVKLANLGEGASNDRSKHTGVQPLNTVTGLQEALDARIPLSAVGLDPAQIPSNQHLGALAYQDVLGVTQLMQHIPNVYPGITWKQAVGDGYEEKMVKPNGEVVDISPITQIRAFGLGVRQLSDPTSPEPIYLYPSSVSNVSPTQFMAALASDTVELSGKPVENVEFAGVSVSRGLRPVQFGVSGRGSLASFWYRGYTTPGSLAADWKRLADLNSPDFTGIPTAPTPAVGTNTQQLQTTAGALAQMQVFGLGNTAGVVVANLETHRTSGAFLADASVSTASGLPLVLQHVITYRPGTSTANGEMWATPLTASTSNGGRVWFRKLNSSVWQPWKEVAFLDSPAFTGVPSAPSLKLGNVASADVNTLDHYEEGTFTPVLAGLTTAGSPVYTANSGEYTRVGNRVNFSFRIAVSSLGGAAGDLRITGLPFLVKGGVANQAGACVSYVAPFPANKSPLALLATNTSIMQLFARDNATTNTSTLQASELTSLNIHIFGSYLVA